MNLALVMKQLVVYEDGQDAIKAHTGVFPDHFLAASEELEELLGLIDTLEGNTQAKRKVPGIKRILALAAKLRV